MTPTEELSELKAQIRRLKKRLREKQKYEMGLLRATGATPEYIAKILEKDAKAMGEAMDLKQLVQKMHGKV